MGVALAILAALTWAAGDFSIEHVSRELGSLKALLYVSLAAAIGFLPFVFKSLSDLRHLAALELLLASGAVFLFASIFDFLALKTGKITVIEPICAFEVPITALAALIFIHEKLTGYQWGLIAAMMVGIFLVSTKEFSHLKRAHAEKGAWFALIATIAMGFANFLFAEAGRVTTPLLINWFAAAFILLALVIYHLLRRDVRASFSLTGVRRGWLGSMMAMDNLSWVFYTYAALYMPISIAIGISESYIVLAALLGYIYNRERLRGHQVVGMALCVATVILLSLTVK